jgi:hypothetical protein
MLAGGTHFPTNGSVAAEVLLSYLAQEVTGDGETIGNDSSHPFSDQLDCYVSIW